jgi:hypothetical protein
MNDNIIDDILTNNGNQNQPKKYPLIIWISVIVIALAFKVNHWPGGHILLVVSTAGYTGISFSGIILSGGSSVFYLISSIIAVFWILLIGYGMLFRNGHPFNKWGLLVFGFVFTLSFVINYLLNKKRQSS